MKALSIIALVLALSACATSVMQGLVGKSINEVTAKYGPPVNTFDAKEKGTAFQWQLGKTLTSSKCYYTLYAKKNAKQDYVVTSFEEPRDLCE